MIVVEPAGLLWLVTVPGTNFEPVGLLITAGAVLVAGSSLPVEPFAEGANGFVGMGLIVAGVTGCGLLAGSL